MQRVPIDQLKPAPWNPRILRDERFKNLCRSIEADPELLDLRPVLATIDGTIYGGNQRYRAVQHLGWKDVPAELSDIPERLAKERALKDNGSWGEWDDGGLAALLADLKTGDTDLDILGFDSDDLDRLLATPKELNEDDADLTPPAEPITKPGDLWLLGEHRLLCGDSTNAADVEWLMAGSNFVLGLHDPPYGRGGYAGRSGNFDAMLGDSGMTEVAAIVRALPLTPARFIWTDWRAYPTLVSVLGQPDAVVVWAKPWPGMGSGYRHQHEWACFYGEFAGGSEFDLWSTDYADEGIRSTWQRTEHANLHPTQKPVELSARAIRNHTDAGDGVLDLFAGSGGSLIAAEQLGRRWAGMEIDPGYCDVICRRWSAVTGREAVRDGKAVKVHA